MEDYANEISFYLVTIFMIFFNLQAQQKQKKTLQFFAEQLFTDEEYSNPPYNLQENWMQALPIE